jgi:hypothetical protein
MNTLSRTSGGVLATILGPRPAPPEPLPAVKEPVRRRRTPRSKKAPAARARYTTYLDRQLLAQVQDAANHLRGHPHYLTVADIIEQGARREIERLQRDLNDGKPFGPTGRRPRTGRPAR